MVFMQFWPISKVLWPLEHLFYKLKYIVNNVARAQGNKRLIKAVVACNSRGRPAG